MHKKKFDAGEKLYITNTHERAKIVKGDHYELRYTIKVKLLSYELISNKRFMYKCFNIVARKRHTYYSCNRIFAFE